MTVPQTETDDGAAGGGLHLSAFTGTMLSSCVGGGRGAGLSSDESGFANLAETVAQLDQTASRGTENAKQRA